MANFPYTDDIPLATNNPSQDQPDMKINTNSIDSLIAVDHVSFNTNNGGYHTLIHAISQTTPFTNVGQIYTQDVTTNSTVSNTDTQQFYTSQNGVISQLTGALTTNTATSDGWQWVGSVLLQWGFVSISTQTSTNTVTFKDRVAGAIPFPNNCFSITSSLVFSSSISSGSINGASMGIVGSTVSKNGFGYKFNVPIANPSNGFYWFAVGN